MRRRDLGLLLVLAVAAVVWAGLQAATGYDAGWTFLMPAVLVAVPLLLGRYLGEERIFRLAQRFQPRAAGRAPRVQGHERALQRVLCRGGELIARSLAVRPPPLALSA